MEGYVLPREVFLKMRVTIVCMLMGIVHKEGRIDAGERKGN